ncbi:MAG: hypothetical protein NZ700_05470 [Gemmataceae bacterium]|nr:hypothetical protein [Gemmataceae bacterium]MDW8267133.1 hypothetical protein [Gemmataceae bacterium]
MRTRILVWTIVIVFGVGAAAAEDKPISPEEAAKRVNQRCVVAMTVLSTGKSKTGSVVFLNSQEDFRDENNFTILLDSRALQRLRDNGIEEPGEHYKGKTIHVTGTVTLHMGRPQIVISDPSNIVMVAK